RLHPVDTEDVVLPRKRATYRAKAVRTWKRAKALTESDSKEVSDVSDAIDPVYSEDSSPECSVTATPAIEAKQEAVNSAILDPQGEPLFDPDALHKHRSGEWYPTDHVAKYIATRVRKPLDKATRNNLERSAHALWSLTWPVLHQTWILRSANSWENLVDRPKRDWTIPCDTVRTKS
ncbi:Hypothetical predicted protein, partial [Pelobates cultripes]